MKVIKGFEDCTRRDWIEFTLWVLSWMAITVILCGIAVIALAIGHAMM